MSTKFYAYKIISGDRIDMISQKFYGRVDNVEPIYQYNPQLKFRVVLEDYVGQTIVIPISESVYETKLKHDIKGV
ncbi:tail protein X [bacterium]|nr:tail protein X [bacterium]